MSEINMSLTWAYKITGYQSSKYTHIRFIQPIYLDYVRKKVCLYKQMTPYHRMLYYTGDLK